MLKLIDGFMPKVWPWLILIVCALGSAGGWVVQGWRLSGQHAQELAARDRQALEVAEAIKQAGIEANNAISAADARAWKGLENDKKELGRLRGCVCCWHLWGAPHRQTHAHQWRGQRFKPRQRGR